MSQHHVEGIKHKTKRGGGGYLLEIASAGLFDPLVKVGCQVYVLKRESNELVEDQCQTVSGVCRQSEI